MGAKVYHPNGPGRAVLVAVACLLLLRPADGRAAAADSAAAYAAEGYWGPVPAMSDSTSAAPTQPGMPAWEGAIVWPWRVITYPIKLLTKGIGAGVVYSDESQLFGKIGALLDPPTADLGIVPSVSLSGLTGFGGGLTFYQNRFFGPDNRFRLGVDGTTKGSWRARTGVRIHEGHDWSLEAGAGYRLRRTARFFGVGPESRAEDESFYGNETSWGGLNLVHRLGATTNLRVSAIATTAGTRRPHEDPGPPIEEEFAGRLPYGYGLRSDGGSVGLELVTGRPRTSRRPEDEAVLRLKASYFDDWNGVSPSFWTWRGEVTQFVPLWFTERSFGVRGILTWTEVAGGGDLPFQRLQSNADFDRFRGYQDFRWTDRGMALVSTEYRWPVWVNRDHGRPGFDMFLLGDVGQVFGEFDQISLDHLTVSYGGGLEFAGSRSTVFRVEVGFSEEESEIRFGAVNMLEASLSRLFYGRPVVPEQ